LEDQITICRRDTRIAGEAGARLSCSSARTPEFSLGRFRFEVFKKPERRKIAENFTGAKRPTRG